MKRLSFILALFFITSLVSIQAQQHINPVKSKINFQITGGSIFNVNGTITGMQGDFNLDPTTLKNANFNICVDVATINTDNEKRDTHLRTSDFFDVEKHPNICFNSSSVTKSTSGYITKGKLTIHGVTKEVEIPFTFSKNKFIGNLVINRFDYDIGKEYGAIRVGKEATVTITCIVN